LIYLHPGAGVAQRYSHYATYRTVLGSKPGKYSRSALGTSALSRE
jgi:hypothetical protein